MLLTLLLLLKRHERSGVPYTLILLLLLTLILFLAFKKLLKAFRPSTALAKYSFQTLKKYKRHVLKYKRHVKRP